MLILIHISAAMASLGLATAAVFKPSSAKLKTAYLLVGLTLASGTMLVINRPGHILSVCLSGLTYLGITSALLVVARTRLID